MGLRFERKARIRDAPDGMFIVSNPLLGTAGDFPALPLRILIGERGAKIAAGNHSREPSQNGDGQRMKEHDALPRNELGGMGIDVARTFPPKPRRNENNKERFSEMRGEDSMRRRSRVVDENGDHDDAAPEPVAREWSRN